MTPKRPVVRPADFKKFPSIAKVLFAGLLGFDTPDKHKQTDNVARALGYTNGLHEAQKCAESARALAAGSLTRFDVQYAVATGLSKLTGLALDETMRRAVRAPLGLLSIDKATVEYADELAARGPDGKLSGADRHRLALKHAATDSRGELLEAGSPGYLFAVRPDGLCVDWMELSSVVKALEISGTPYQIGKVEAQSWVPLSDRLHQGLRVPLHDLVALFAPDGEYIGYVFRHTVHGGILPTLMVSAEDVHRGKMALLSGRSIPATEGSSPIALFGVDGEIPVFILKPGVSQPVPPTEPWNRPMVDTTLLEQLHGVTGSYERYIKLNGTQGQNVWSLSAERKVRPSIEDFNGYPENCIYLETEAWLKRSDLPRLFKGSVDQEPPRRDPADPFGSKQLTFVPEFARDLLREARGLLADELEECDAMLPSYSRDVVQRFDSCDPDLYSRVESLAGRELGQIVPNPALLAASYQAVCDDHPLLSRFGHKALWLAQQMCTPKVSAGLISPDDIVTALVLLSGCAAAGTTVPDITAPIRTLALARWVEGRCPLEEIPALAADFQSYQGKLDRQATMIADLDMILDHRAKTDRRARALRYAFLYGQVMSTRAIPEPKAVRG